MKVLEDMGCHSSVARALVAKVRGPGFDSPVTTKIFHILPLLLSRPLAHTLPLFLSFFFQLPLSGLFLKRLFYWLLFYFFRFSFLGSPLTSR